MPRISILLPCFQPRIDHLRQALDCLLAQTMTDWHCTIVNQPWETDVQSGIEDLLRHERITFVQSDTLRSIGANWNACMPYATAPFVQFLFHDDLWGPRYLERSLETLENNKGCGFCAAHHSYRYEGDIENRELYEHINMLRLEMLPGRHSGRMLLQQWLQRGLHPNIIGEPPFVMMRRDVMERVGTFAEDLPQFLDSEYWARLLSVTDFFYIHEPLGEFRIHHEAASARNQRAGKGLTDRLRCLWRMVHHPNRTIALASFTALCRELPKMIVKYVRRITGR